MAEPPSKIQKTDGEPAQEGTEGTARAGTMQSSVSKETPISIPPTITYGLQETHTTILPVCFWLTAAGLVNTNAATLNLSLNTIYNILHDTVIVNTAPFNDAIIVSKKAQHQTYLSQANDDYPLVTSSTTSPNPWYRSYWEKLYMYYTVLNCNYEITMYNASNGDVTMGHTIRTQGNASNTVIPNNMLYLDAQGMKNLQWQNIPGFANETTSGQNRYQVLSGNYKPGSAKKDVSNDGDTKLWTANTQSTQYKEQLQLNFWRNPLFARTNGTATVNANPDAHNVNIQIRLKYTVQYKQLVQGISYPTQGATSTVLYLPAHSNPHIADPSPTL